VAQTSQKVFNAWEKSKNALDYFPTSKEIAREKFLKRCKNVLIELKKENKHENLKDVLTSGGF
tara:strand:+ start:224 stop:412 length:189 start_codon:yes stop_codon:yes gene_type:complete